MKAFLEPLTEEEEAARECKASLVAKYGRVMDIVVPASRPTYTHIHTHIHIHTHTEPNSMVGTWAEALP